MRKTSILIRAFAADTRGATVIEYGLICSLVFLVVVGAITTMSGNLINNFWNPTAAALKQ